MDFYRLRLRSAVHRAARQTAADVAPLLRCHPDAVLSLLTRPGHVLIGGLTLADVSLLQCRLRQAGCLCVIEKDDAPGSVRRRPGGRRGEAGVRLWLLPALVLAALLVWLLG